MTEKQLPVALDAIEEIARTVLSTCGTLRQESATVTALHEEKAGLLADCERLKAERADLRAQLEAERVETERERAHLAGSLEGYRADVAALKAEIAAHEVEVTKAREDMAEYQRVRARVQKITAGV